MRLNLLNYERTQLKKVPGAPLFYECMNLTGFAGTSDAKRLWTAVSRAALAFYIFLLNLRQERLSYIETTN